MIPHVGLKGLGKATAFGLALPHPWHSFFLLVLCKQRGDGREVFNLRLHFSLE